MSTRLYRPIQPFVTPGPDGAKWRFHPDQVVAGDHWVLKGRQKMFRPVEDDIDRGDRGQAIRRPITAAELATGAITAAEATAGDGQDARTADDTPQSAAAAATDTPPAATDDAATPPRKRSTRRKPSSS